MADARLGRVFESLETSFDAAVAREEDEAASDLAFSLLQGRALLDLATRAGPWDLDLGGGVRVPLSLVGRDFVAGGRPPRVLVPGDRAVLSRASSGEPAQTSDAALIEELRGLSGFGSRVEVTTPRGAFRGSLIRVSPDHVALGNPAGETMIGLQAILQVALLARGAG